MTSLNSLDFVLIKDPHFMFGFRNNIRKHGWEKDIDNKIDQILDYCSTNNISRVFFTGDIFEKNKKKDWSLNQLQQNKARLKRFRKMNIEVYSNAGNHDYFDGREDIDGTVFGEMVEAGLINYVGSETPPVNFLIGDEDYISLYGIDHHQSQDKILDRLGYISAQEGTKIVLMHSNITDKSTRLTDFTYSQLQDYNIDIIGCGHWHLAPEKGPVQEMNKTWFLNPWNLTRVARDYHVKLDEHRPQMIHASIVLVGDEFTFDFKIVDLQVRPFSEAFNIDAINLLQELGKTGFDFFKKIDLEKEEDINDDASLIETLAEAHGISQSSIKIAKELLL